MAAAAPRAPNPAVRERILAAADKRFQRFGYRRTNVAGIARDAGVAAGTVYLYFRSKEEIFREVVREAASGWAKEARRILDQPGTAVEHLARLGQASAEHYRRNKIASSILTRDTEMVLAPLLEEMRDELLDDSVAVLAEAIRRGIKEGSIRRVDPKKAAFILVLAGDALTNQDRYDYGDLFPVFSEITSRGLVVRDK